MITGHFSIKASKSTKKITKTRHFITRHFEFQVCKHAVARLNKAPQKRRVKGSALGFSKRKKKTEAVPGVLT